MIQSGGLLGRLLGPILKTGLPLMKNVIKPLAKSVLIHLGLTASVSAADTGRHKKILGSGHSPLSSALHNNTILIISNNEMKDIIRMAKCLEDFGLLLKGVIKTIQNESKEQKGGFIGTLGASLLRNILAGKGINRAGERVIIAGNGNKKQNHTNKMDF